MRPAILAVLITLPLAASAMAAVSGDGKLGSATGNVAGSSACPAGQAVTAVSGRTGLIAAEAIVGSVSVSCADGTSGAAMGTGAPDASSSCAAGQVAVGVTGREGDFIDQLSIRCRAAALTGDTTTATGYGGSGGTADGPYDCPGGERLSGLTGLITSDGSTVTQLEIACAKPPTPEGPPPENPGGPAGGTPLTITAARAKSRRNGTVVLPVDVPGAGRAKARNIPLSAVRPAARRALFKSTSVSSTAAGRVKLVLRPTRAGRKLLKRKGKFRAGVRVSFTATDGTAATPLTRKVLFKKKRRP
jgi:hypothetical protein